MAVIPVVVCISQAGLTTARAVARHLGAQVHGRAGRVDQADVQFDNTLDHVRTLFAAGIPVVGVCASGILIRAVAPLLHDKRSEPPVLSVSDDGAVVVPLLGGHRGANRLAAGIAKALEATAAVTTAGDLALGLALDEPPVGYRLQNPENAKTVMANLLGGQDYILGGAQDWMAGILDLPNVQTGTAPPIRGTYVPPAILKPADGRLDPDARLIAHCQQFTLGVGCARGADPDQLWTLVQTALLDAGVAPDAVASVNSIDLKADEPAVIALARRLNVPLRLFTAAELEAETPRLHTPSDVVFAEVGCHGVAEAAALAASGLGGQMAITKQKTAQCTMALAWAGQAVTAHLGRARGHLSLISAGPGQADWRTPEASRLVQQADELVGYGLYIDLLGPLAAGKPRRDFPLGGEEARCRYALEEAAKGRNIALICSGDAGIYAMGALVFELLDRREDQGGVSAAAKRVAVQCTPGVSALQGAAARAGAPLGHDFCTISLSDLLTPREDILRRLHAAAQGDFVIAFYNPVSKTRRTLLATARDILLQHRPPQTPVMLATSLGRPDEHIRYRPLEALDVDEVDMLTVVIVGSSHTRLSPSGESPRMFTPRGYARKMGGD